MTFNNALSFDTTDIELQGLKIEKNEDQGWWDVELDPNWAYRKHLLTAVVKGVVEKTPAYRRQGTDCISVLGRGTERTAEEAIRYWTAKWVHKTLPDTIVAVDIPSLVNTAYAVLAGILLKAEFKNLGL